MCIAVLDTALVFSVIETNGRRTKLEKIIPELRSLVENIGQSMQKPTAGSKVHKNILW